MKKIIEALSTAIVILVVIAAVFLMGSRLAGYKVFNVISGSMSPIYEVGDLIYVKELSSDMIKVGDVITFVMDENLNVATHRVVGIDEEKMHFITKGDANEAADASPVHFNNLIGVPRFSIPYLGYVSDFIQNPPGIYISVGVLILLALIVFLPDIVKGKKKEEKFINSPSSDDIKNN